MYNKHNINKPIKNNKSNKVDIKQTFQTSLDKWFVRTDTEGNVIESTYKIFYLEWTATTQSAAWISCMPLDDKISYRATVKCPSINEELIHIIGWIPDPIKLSSPLNESYYTNIAYLKSHLQKAIRRRQTHLALKTANHFFRLDPTEFLRRLGIIMLEDVHLIESFNILTWLMVASSKGYQLDKSQIYWLFGLVYNLCKAENWDRPIDDAVEGPIEHQNISNIRINNKEDSWKQQLSKLNVMQKSLIYSLQFRKAYGGLPGDKKLISSLTRTWIQRFIANKSLITSETMTTGITITSSITTETKTDPLESTKWITLLKGPPNAIQFLSPPEEGLALNQWILSAIDFHCAPNIISILCDKYEEFTADDIKSAIWHCNSKYNDRTYAQPDKKYIKIWKKIRSQFYGLANYFLIHNY